MDALSLIKNNLTKMPELILIDGGIALPRLRVYAEDNEVLVPDIDEAMSRVINMLMINRNPLENLRREIERDFQGLIGTSFEKQTREALGAFMAFGEHVLNQLKAYQLYTNNHYLFYTFDCITVDAIVLRKFMPC